MVELKVPLGTGRNTSGCRGCGEVFTSITSFDRHQRKGKCLPPAEVGLVQNDKGRWHFPSGEELMERSDGRGAAARYLPATDE
jgi:hypothetical protein